MSAESEIDRLATYILNNFPGEPGSVGCSESAVDVAIRLLGRLAEGGEKMITIWQEFTKLPGTVEITRWGDWYRRIEKFPEIYVPRGPVSFEVDGEPASPEGACDALKKMIRGFPFERGKKYTIKIVEQE